MENRSTLILTLSCIFALPNRRTSGEKKSFHSIISPDTYLPFLYIIDWKSGAGSKISASELLPIPSPSENGVMNMFSARPSSREKAGGKKNPDTKFPPFLYEFDRGNSNASGVDS